MATKGVAVFAAAVLCVALLAGQVAARSKDPKHTDKLVEFIKKKNYDKFVEELSREVDNGLGEPKGIDTNQPDSKGRLPIIEAVRTKDLKYVDALIQFGALTKVKDPATGATPVHVAFQQNMGEIARVLLAYGADINVEDKSNKKAREFAPSEDIRSLIVDYDKFGPSAFEDAPGTWIKEKKENGEMYWFNVKTNEARWNTPPSCGWVRVDIQGQPHKYINTVTGQEVTKTPAALAWALVRANSTEMWYNWRLNLTQVEQPDEPPTSVLDEARKNLNVRWYNEHTGDFSWEDPKYHGPWREVKEEGAEPYYFNVETGESRWEIPEELEWVVVDHETGRPYYFNQKSGDSSWEAPHPHLAWTKHDSDL